MNYKEVIEARYNREAWQQLLHDIFLNKVQFYNSTNEVKVSSRLAKRALYIGRISLSDGESLAIYEVELADKVDIERNKRGIRDMLTKDWKDMGHAGAFMFCYRREESILRFSYVSETWGVNKKGDYEKLSTNTKRYTYLLGEGRGCRTAIEQFSALKESKQALSDITAAFSVEALTKQFYKELFEWYLWAVDPATGVYFPNDTSTEDDDREDIETKMIRMITRIMFVWFIKQKDLVPDKIFDADFLRTILKDFDPESKENGNYYNAILQNLFFATLNRAIEDEHGNKRRFAANVKTDIKTLYRYAEMFTISKEDVIKLFSEVPFLNGGLFECLDKTKTIDGVDRPYNYDGFSRNDTRYADGHYHRRAMVPNILFFDEERGLLSILCRYNFTIEENSPEEQQVALDPELLGKVFENLLGAYNPETRETARNLSGSFYTPREIVNYMVDESLIAYLGNTSFVRSLFSSEFAYDKAKAADYDAVAAKQKAIKILDPACGSGAFPMGLLNRMIDILVHISPNENVYDLKLSIIENCIYGSDIQSIATQITKLRFFISLICNCEKDASKPNFGIPTLPNLETKFVAANSLIAMKKQPTTGCFFENPEIKPTKQALTEIRHEHFAAKTAGRKTALRQRDQELREKLALLLADENNYAPADAKQMAEWNPYDQNAVAPFFDPEWMFGVSGGFDLVIGNPPYIQLQNNGGELAKLYADCNYKTFARTGDIYCLFYERGHQLLKPNGHLCYITSNKWMRAGYGEKTRDFFAKYTNPMLLIDFAGVKIFESATVDTNILLFAKAQNEHKTLCAVTNKQNKDSVKNLSVFLRHLNDFGQCLVVRHAGLSVGAAEVLLHSLEAFGDVGDDTAFGEGLELYDFLVEVAVVDFPDEAVEQAYGRADLCAEGALRFLRILLAALLLVANRAELLKGHVDVLVVLPDACHGLLAWGGLEVFEGIEHGLLPCAFRHEEEHLAEVRFEEHERVARKGDAVHLPGVATGAAAQRQLCDAVVFAAVGHVERTQLFVERQFLVAVFLFPLDAFVEQLAHVSFENLFLRVNLVVLAEGGVERLNLAQGNLGEVDFTVAFARGVEHVVVDVL